MKVAYFLLLSGALLTACSSTRSRGGGPVFDGAVGQDSSIEDGTRGDGSIIVTGPDGSVGQPDATSNQPDATVSTPDASILDNRTRMCGMNSPTLRAIWDEPRCGAGTLDCIEACDGDTQEQLVACINLCVDADTTTPQVSNGVTVDCSFCLSYEPIVCLYNNGCDTAIADFNCCLTDKCSGLTGQAAQSCAQSMCASEGQAQNTCFETNAARCNSAGNSCFP